MVSGLQGTPHSPVAYFTVYFTEYCEGLLCTPGDYKHKSNFVNTEGFREVGDKYVWGVRREGEVFVL